MIGNGHEFNCGRQFAAWLGLTPGQYSSGGKTRLGRITKAGDGYLRSLLILGARSVLALAKGKSDALQPLGAGAAAAPRLLEGGGGHRGEERAHGLGGARSASAARALQRCLRVPLHAAGHRTTDRFTTA